MKEGDFIILRNEAVGAGLRSEDVGVIWAVYDMQPPFYDATFDLPDGRQLDVTVNEDEFEPFTPMAIYVDVDNTFVRDDGNQRIPIPAVIEYVKSLWKQGIELYCWSSGGAAYARESAAEFGIVECFTAFLPKPNVLIDDQAENEWRRLVRVSPQWINFIVPLPTVNIKADLARLYNLERARFLRGEVDRIAPNAVSFGQEIGFGE